MRRINIGAIALLIVLAGCSGDGSYSDGSYSGSSSTAYTPYSPYAPPGTSQTTPVPPQAGQAGQTSQQARQNIAEQPGGAQALSGTTGMGVSGATGQLTAADQAFVIEAAQHGAAEVQLGRLAEQKASNASVRDFGSRMVQQHSQANQDLMQVASRVGVSPPTSLSPAAQAVQNQLQQLSGSSFDRQYLQQQYADHSAQLTMFRFAADNASDPELRAFAQKNAPVVQQHLDMLQSMTPTVMRTGP